MTKQNNTTKKLMADITKCKGTGCPVKATCYRFYCAESSKEWQSWFVTPPIQNGKCDLYWGKEEKDIWTEIKLNLPDGSNSEIQP